MDQFSTGWKKRCPITCSKEVSLLIAGMEKIAAAQGAQSKEWPELKTLKEKCCSDNISEVYPAFQGLTMLVEKKILVGSQTLASLISLLPSVHYYTPLIMTIGDILLFEFEENDGKNKFQYNFSDKLHPFATILKHDTEKSWDSIFSYIQHILYNNNNIKLTSKIEMLKPALLYIFINPDFKSSPCKCDVFDLLMEQVDKPEIKFLVFELFAWQNLDMNYCRLIKKMLNCYLNTLGEEEKKEVVASLIPYLSAAIKWLIMNAHNPLPWIDLLSKSLEVTKDGSSVALYLLSDVFQETPTCFITRLADLCTSIIYSGSCNKYIAYKFAAVSLLWMVNPSPAEEPLLKTLESVIKFLAFKCEASDWSNNTIDLNENPYFKIIRYSIGEVKFAFDMAVITDSWNDETSILKWVKNLAISNYPYVQATQQTLLSGILISENDDELLDTCLDILWETSAINNNLCRYCVCVIFFKLSRESEPKRQLTYLRYLASIANSKENLPLIVGIIETLKNTSMPTMWPVVIDLYLMIWRRERRIYPYLHKTLFTSSIDYENSWEMSTIKSLAIKELCESSPGVHGKGLISKLSDVLNSSDKFDSGIPTAIAIEAVIGLCKASVIDILGTWRTLKPKLSHDTRPAVLVRLCMLFGEIPSLKSPCSERDDSLNDIIPRLWDYAFSENMEVVKVALVSLSKFGPDAYGPKLLPDILKREISLSRKHLKDLKETPKTDIIDELDYIPGECWIELLQKIDPRVRTEAGNMLKVLIDKEIRFFPRSLFCHSEDRPEPESYEHLPPNSVCRAFERHIKAYLSDLKPGTNKVPQTVIELLRVLSSDFCKNLPYLNWSFLTKFFPLGDECKRYSLLILVKQAGSKSGKVLESYVVDNLPKFNDVNEFLFLYSVLPDICSYLSPNTLRLFLEKTLRSSFQSSLHSGTDDFDHVLNTATSIIDGKFVPETRKPLLVVQLQNILALIPPGHELMRVYARYAHRLPPKTYECITSPSYWPQITSERIRQSLTIRASTVSRPDSLHFMSSFNDLLDTVCHFPSESEVLLCTVLEVMPRIRHMGHTNWFLELLMKIEHSSSNLSMRGSITVTLFFLDILIIAVVTAVGYDCLLMERDEQNIKSNIHKIFPIALYKLISSVESPNTSLKILQCIHSLSEWKRLPLDYAQVLEQALIINKDNINSIDKNKWQKFLYIPMEMKFQ